MENQYPECEKMAKVKDKSQIIGEFIDWIIETQKFIVCVDSGYGGYYPVNITIEELLAKFFGIDLNKVEEERRQMLDEIRKKNE